MGGHLAPLLQKMAQEEDKKIDPLLEGKIRTLARKGYSAGATQKVLSQKNIQIHKDDIDRVHKELGTTEEEQVHFLIQKKIRHTDLSSLNEKESLKLKRRLLSLLFSRGHFPPMSTVDMIFHNGRKDSKGIKNR